MNYSVHMMTTVAAPLKRLLLAYRSYSCVRYDGDAFTSVHNDVKVQVM